ncbi:MAG: DUF2796 domain-containing protein [Paracoccaceae bacterium]
MKFTGNAAPARPEHTQSKHTGYMMKHSLSLIALVAAMPAIAQDSRQLDAHEHGVGTLNIAIDGTTVAMAFEAPGADIVGFEYAAESDADLAAIDTAIATLGAPLDLFVLPEAAACRVTEAKAELETEDNHDDHGHDEHEEHADEKHDDHDDHEEHDDEKHDDHDHDEHEEHADEKHDDHDHDEHEEHADEEHDDHDDHAEEAGHTEFHAEYTLACDNPDALTQITFSYFESFPNALEVEVQVITDSGAQAYEVERDEPVLKLGS